jgi:hypothetical protein
MSTERRRQITLVPGDICILERAPIVYGSRSDTRVACEPGAVLMYRGTVCFGSRAAQEELVFGLPGTDSRLFSPFGQVIFVQRRGEVLRVRPSHSFLDEIYGRFVTSDNFGFSSCNKLIEVVDDNHDEKETELEDWTDENGDPQLPNWF